MELGMAALFIIWMISRSNLSTDNGTTTPSGSWVTESFTIGFIQGTDRGVIGIQRWTGNPQIFRLYVRYGSSGPITPLVGTYNDKRSAQSGAANWVAVNAPPDEGTIGTLSTDMGQPEGQSQEEQQQEQVEVLQDFTIIDATGGKEKAINQQAKTLSLNGTQDYALNG